jgi:hypothetical protein
MATSLLKDEMRSSPPRSPFAYASFPDLSPTLELTPLLCDEQGSRDALAHTPPSRSTPRPQHQPQRLSLPEPLSTSPRSDPKQQRLCRHQQQLFARDIKQHVDAAFSLVDVPENAWAHSFVLDNSPSGTIQMMTNPMAIANAVTARVSDVCFNDGDSSTSPSASCYDRNLDIEGLIVPAFSSGDVSVGVGVHRIAPASSRPIPSSQYSNSVGRVARCDLTGEMLMVKSTPSCTANPSGQVQILHMRHASTRQRERRLIICDPDLFATGDVAGSVLMVSHSIESRFCPTCNASPSVECACAISTVRSRHPFDFASVFTNMSSHFGSFIGQSTTTVVISGADQAGICGGGDERSLVNVQSMCLQTGPPALSNLFRGLSAPGLLNRPKRYLQAPLASHIQMDGFSARHPGINNVHSRIAGVLQSFALQLHFCPAPPRLVTGQSSQMHCPPQVLVLGDDSANEKRDTMEPGLSDAILALHPVGYGVGAVGDITARSAAECATNIAVLAGLGSTSACVGSNSGSSSGSSYPESSAALRPRVHVPAVCGRRRSTKNLNDDELIAREVERRDKNRLAAARSNARRKARNDGLKASLTSERQHVAKLRAKREILQAENICLRREVGRMR